MITKKKRYLGLILSAVVILAILVTTGSVLSKKRLESRQEEMKMQVYIAYVILNNEVMLAQNREQLEKITADKIINEYAVGVNTDKQSDNFYITANINAETEDYYISSFRFYDEDIKTAFVLDDESGELETVPVKKHSEYKVDKSEITIGK
jgi:hypothetical protein